MEDGIYYNEAGEPVYLEIKTAPQARNERRQFVTILGHDIMMLHLDSGSSAWFPDGVCIGRFSKMQDQYRTEAGELLTLQAALESAVRKHLAESAVIERV